MTIITKQIKLFRNIAYLIYSIKNGDTINDLVKKTGMPYAIISIHLGNLSQQGLIEKNKIGRQYFISLTSRGVTLHTHLAHLIEKYENNY